MQFCKPLKAKQAKGTHNKVKGNAKGGHKARMLNMSKEDKAKCAPKEQVATAQGPKKTKERPQEVSKSQQIAKPKSKVKEAKAKVAKAKVA